MKAQSFKPSAQSSEQSLYLIKDYIDGRIVLFWTTDNDAKASPLFSTIDQAKDWWLERNDDQYLGQTDIDIKVDEDRSRQSLNIFFAGYPRIVSPSNSVAIRYA